MTIRLHQMRIFPTTVAVVLLGTALVRAQNSPDFETPVRTVLDPGVIPTRQAITPAGAQTVFESRVWGVVFGPSNDVVYALTAGRNAPPMVYKMDWRTNRVLEKLRIPVAPGMQAIEIGRASCRERV